MCSTSLQTTDMEVEEDPEEEPEEDFEEEPEEIIPLAITSPPVSPAISPPPLLESLSDSDSAAPVTANRASWVPPPGSTFEVGGPLSVPSPPPYLLGCEVKRLREDTETLYGSVRTMERDAFDVDLGFIEQDATRVSDDV
ncbi:hypothetical protein Tco_0958429 [Tanacetum coccineum]